MTCGLRIDRIIDLDGDTVFQWAFQDLSGVAMDLSAYTLLWVIFAGDSILFSKTVGSGLVVGATANATDERGVSMGTVTPVTGTITEAEKAALSDAQKAGPWIYKFIPTPAGGPTLVHDWGECTVLQTEIPDA